jgi:flagellar protein FlaG
MDVTSINNLTASVAAEPSAPRPLTDDQRALIRAVRAVNAAELFGHENELAFAVDSDSRRTVVRIVDRNTHEVIDQIPPEYVLRMAEELRRS